MSKNRITVMLDLTRQQIRMLASYSEKNVSLYESKFYELSGTDKESQGDIYYSDAQNWNEISETFKSYLKKENKNKTQRFTNNEVSHLIAITDNRINEIKRENKAITDKEALKTNEQVIDILKSAVDKLSKIGD